MTDSVENYDRVCSRMAQDTGHIVVSVEYRLAPEYLRQGWRSRCGSQELYTDHDLNIDPDKITIMETVPEKSGSSVCLMARDRENLCQRQILIYPALGNCYTEESPYKSVHENGTDYLLTSERMEKLSSSLREQPPGSKKSVFFSADGAESIRYTDTDTDSRV